MMECEKCVTDCKATEGHEECIKLCRNCADICSLCARLSARGSKYADALRALCAESCEECAVECNKREMECFKKAAVACQKCAEACKK